MSAPAITRVSAAGVLPASRTRSLRVQVLRDLHHLGLDVLGHPLRGRDDSSAVHRRIPAPGRRQHSAALVFLEEVAANARATAGERHHRRAIFSRRARRAALGGAADQFRSGFTSDCNGADFCFRARRRRGKTLAYECSPVGRDCAGTGRSRVAVREKFTDVWAGNDDRGGGHAARRGLLGRGDSLFAEITPLRPSIAAFRAVTHFGVPAAIDRWHRRRGEPRFSFCRRVTPFVDGAGGCWSITRRRWWRRIRT